MYGKEIYRCMEKIYWCLAKNYTDVWKRNTLMYGKEIYKCMEKNSSYFSFVILWYAHFLSCQPRLTPSDHFCSVCLFFCPSVCPSLILMCLPALAGDNVPWNTPVIILKYKRQSGNYAT